MPRPKLRLAYPDTVVSPVIQCTRCGPDATVTCVENRSRVNGSRVRKVTQTYRCTGCKAQFTRTGGGYDYGSQR